MLTEAEIAGYANAPYHKEDSQQRKDSILLARALQRVLALQCESLDDEGLDCHTQRQKRPYWTLCSVCEIHAMILGGGKRDE